MGTTADKLQAVLDSKNAIKTALSNKGKNPTDVMSTYAGLIDTLTDLTPEVKSFALSTNIIPIYMAVAATDGERIVVITTYNTRAAYSDDNGATWTTFTISYGYDYQDMVYAKGKYVCVAAAQENVIYSTDGTTWNTASIGYTGDWKSIAHGNGTFVAVCQNSNQAAYSLDGTEWNLVSLPESRDWRAVRWCKDRFIAIAKDTEYAAYSYDGTVWSEFTLPSAEPWCDVAYGNGKTVVITGGDEYVSTDVIAYTTDMDGEWNTATLPESYNYKNIAYNNGIWLITTGTSYIMYGFDGLTYTEQNMAGTTALGKIVYLNGVFVAFPSCNSAQEAAIITTKLPPSDATYLGSATPEDVPCGVTFSSVHGFGLEGSRTVNDAETYVLTNAAGTQRTLALLNTEQTVVPTATENDIRSGTTAITNTGYIEGTKDIPAYYSGYGTILVQAGTEATISVLEYDYKNLMVTIAPFNSSIDESTAVNYVSVENSMYMVNSTEKISDITKDTEIEQVNLGITVSELSVLRYFIVREEA